ncbi:MAG: periplasmic heavy metal sensor [Dongiaceae bacterium]
MNLARMFGFCVALAILAARPAAAQDHGNVVMPSHSPGASAAIASPYAGMEKRLVKALSDRQIAELKAGRGMELALAAELNGYPGPSHVLDLADALQLSDQQRTRTTALLEAMKAETIPIGERIIAEETALDHLFAARRVTRASLDSATSEIGAAQGALRSAHLRYHLAMVEILSPAQLARYAELRGYAESSLRDHGTQ